MRASRASGWRGACAGVCAAAVAAAAGTGCAPGHGKYTTEFKDHAELRMTQMKAATQWDLAQQQFLAGDLAKALRSVDDSLAMQPEVAKSHVLRGRILVEMGRLEAALESFAAAGAIEPGSADPHYYRGIVLERFGQFDGAFEAYGRASEIDPTNAQFALASAEMLIQMDRLDEARGLLESGRSTFRHNAGVRQTLGHIAAMQGDMAQAAAMFQEAALLAPDEPSILEDLARAEIAAGRFAEGEYTLSQLLRNKNAGSRRDLKHLRARCLLELDRPVEARTLLLELVGDEQGQRDVRAWLELGNAALVINDQARVRESALRLMAIAPQRHEGYTFMALWQKQRGDGRSAAATLDKAIAVAGSDPTPALLQATVYEDLGRFGDAERSLAVARAASPGDPRVERAWRALASVETGIDGDGSR